MNNNYKIYQKSVKKNLFDIKATLKDLEIEKEIPISLYENILNQSASMITSKWSSGRKYCRTYFVQKAFGKLYPIKYTQTSLLIDAMINILDDLLDESLSKQAKTEYILEFLRIFSIYSGKCSSKQVQKSLEKYFNKLITLAVAENFYQQQTIKEQDQNKIIKNSADLLICRGRDIDIFIEIATLNIKNQRIVEMIKKISRIFRAINILKKDIKDIEHDKKNNIETIVTLAMSKDKNNFFTYINNLLNIFSNRVGSIMKIANNSNRKSLYHLLPVYNFAKMIQEEKKEILKIIQSL